MKPHDIARQRLRNQRLTGERLAAPEDVVHWLGAMQSQEYAVAKWSVGQRAKHATEGALDQALANGSILRTHVLRPTWHFVLPADIRWTTALTAPRVHALNAYWYRKFGVDDALAARAQAVMAAALAGGNHLTRKELATLLAAHGIAADGLRLGYILMRAELDLVVCSGAPKGKQQSYALVDERAPRARSLTRDEALGELTARYFTSRGPASVKDYARWSSLTVADAKRGLAMVRPALERMVVADRTYWFAPAAPAPPAGSPTAHLLQGYDEYVIAYSESKDVLDVAGAAGSVADGETMFTHAVVLNGQVTGHWRRVVKPRAVAIEVQLVTPVDAAQRSAITTAVERYGTFVGMPATWS